MVVPSFVVALAAVLVSTTGPSPAGAPAALHPNSWTRSLIVVTADDGVHHFMRLQVLSLLEVVPDADPDKNRLVEPHELLAVRDQFAAYLTEHYRIGPAGQPPWEAELVSAELINNDADALNFEQLIDVERHIDVDRAPVELTVGMTLFLDTSPRHFDMLDVTWPDGSAQESRLWAARTEQSFVSPQGAAEPTAVPSSLAQDLWLGAEHILYGLDHIAFLLALLVASARLRSLIAVVTAFTLSHSVTLTLAAMDIVRLPGRQIELVIAASIAYVGLVNLIRKGPRPLWIEAFVFGLIHGLGFASALARLLPEGDGRLRTLITFNVGIELGQLAIVLVVVALLALVRRRSQEIEPALAPPAVRTAVSAAVFLAGWWWLVERFVGG